jgi:hypothetical protein
MPSTYRSWIVALGVYGVLVASLVSRGLAQPEALSKRRNLVRIDLNEKLNRPLKAIPAALLVAALKDELRLYAATNVGQRIRTSELMLRLGLAREAGPEAFCACSGAGQLGAYAFSSARYPDVYDHPEPSEDLFRAQLPYFSYHLELIEDRIFDSKAGRYVVRPQYVRLLYYNPNQELDVLRLVVKYEDAQELLEKLQLVDSHNDAAVLSAHQTLTNRRFNGIDIGVSGVEATSLREAAALRRQQLVFEHELFEF